MRVVALALWDSVIVVGPVSELVVASPGWRYPAFDVRGNTSYFSRLGFWIFIFPIFVGVPTRYEFRFWDFTFSEEGRQDGTHIEFVTGCRVKV